jgi:hypothetical protein
MHDASSCTTPSPFGKPAVTDARVLGIELDDVDAGDERVEHVGARHHFFEGGFDARLGAAVLEPMPVVRRNHDGPAAALHNHRGAAARERLSRRQNPRACSCGHEVPPIDFVGHG